MTRRRRKILSCPECDEVFIDQVSLDRHQATHQPVTPQPFWEDLVEAPPDLPAIGAWKIELARCGSTPLFDVTPLSGGCFLVAMGAEGVAVVSPKGEILERHPIACWSLVGGRSEVILHNPDFLYRFESQSGQLRRWCRPGFTRSARQHNDEHWLVATHDSLMAVDLSSPSWVCSRQVRLPYPIFGWAVGERELSVEMWASELEKFALVFSIPDFLRLNQFPLPERRSGASSGLPRTYQVLGPSRCWELTLDPQYRLVSLDATPLPSIPWAGDWEVTDPSAIFCGSDRGDGVFLLVLERPHFSRQCLIRLRHTFIKDRRRVGWRRCGDLLYVVDTRGRLLVVDLVGRRLQSQFWL